MTRFLFLVLPCAAVFTGLQFLRSAWAAILLYHTVIVVCLFLRNRNRNRMSLLEGWSFSPGMTLTLVCLLCGPILVMLWPIMERGNTGFLSMLESFGLGGGSFLIFALYYISLHPVLEELFWRDALAGRGRSVGASDIAFAAYHVIVLIHFMKIPWVVLAFLVLALVSFLWRWIAGRHGGLAIPLASHIAAGIGIMTAAYYLSHH
jgi:membrane protease YdiL (CAAX protease family)